MALSRSEKTGIVVISAVALFIIGVALLFGFGLAFLVQQGGFDDLAGSSGYGRDYGDSPFADQGVHVAELPIERRQVLSHRRLGTVTSLVAETGRIGVAGSEGVVYVDFDFDEDYAWRYRGYGNLSFVDMDGDGTHEIVSSSFESIQLLDDKGESLWEVPGEFSMYPPLAGDLDGDGSTEIVIQTWDVNAGGSGGFLSELISALSDVSMDECINIVDAEGQLLLSKRVAGLYEIAGVKDIDGDGFEDIIYNDWDDNLVTCDSHLHEIDRAATSLSLQNTFVHPWPGRDGDLHVVNMGYSPVAVLELDGDVVREYVAPGVDWGHALTTPWKAYADGPPLFAIIASSYDEGAALYVYDSEGVMVYEEVTDECFTALAAYTPPGEDAEVLLIGGEGAVWAYTLDEAAFAGIAPAGDDEDK